MAIETPLNELDAVNCILTSIGESPVSTLEGGTVADVAIAQSILNECSHQIQEIGWQFNSECNYPLVPDIDGNITLPANIVRVDQDTTNDTGDYDLVQRGRTLYDRKNRTSVFTQTIKAEVVLLLAFADTPPSFRRYATLKAARQFQARMVGSEVLYRFSEQDEAEARSAFEESEGENADYSIFDNYAVYRSVNR